MKPSRVSRTLAVCGAVLGLPVRVGAQDTPPTAWARGYDVHGAASSSPIAWLGAWSPLRPIVDIPRGMLRAPLAPGLLEAPAPMAGAFVLSGAPGAIARDLTPRLAGDTTRFSDLRVRFASDAGDYRRPLDLAESRVTQFSGSGFAHVGARTVVAGRTVIDREYSPVSSFSELLTPYRSNPFVDTDSVTPPMRRSRARFEGALGVRLAGFGIGASGGVESREHSSIDFPLRRGGRGATPAVTTGVEHRLPWLNGRAGVFYRWSEPTETYVLNVNPLQTTMYALVGLDEPMGVPVTDLPILARIDRRTTAVGGTIEITALDTRIVLTHEQGNRAEDQYRSVTTQRRPTDRWRAKGSETRVMAQRAFGVRTRATMVGSLESLDGTAVRQDLTGIAYTATEDRLAVEADMRRRLSQVMQVAIVGGATRVSLSRRDFVAPLQAELVLTTPYVAAEMSRQVGTTAVAVGASIAQTVPSGDVPSADRGENYRRVIAPMIAYEGAEARAFAGWLTVSVPVRGRTVMGTVRAERASPTSVATQRLQPGGSRSGWSMSIGMR